jgi:hypothetical protein
MFDDLAQGPTPQKPAGMFADLGSTAVNPDDNLPDSGIYKYLPKAVNAGLVATGREFDKIGGGLKSGWLQLTGQDKALSALRADEKLNDAAYAPLAEARPGSTFVGSVAPYIAMAPGALASSTASALRVIAPRAAEKIAQSMVVDGALQGALLGQVRQGNETDALTGGLSGAVGGAAGRLLQKVVSPSMGGLSAQQQNVVASVNPLGGRLTPGQATGNQTLQRIEAGLESNPVTSFAMRGVKEANQVIVNRAATKAIGEAGNSLDATVLANAEDRIGNIYKMVRTKKPVDLAGLSKPASEIMAEAETLTVNPNAMGSDPLFNKALDFITKGAATQEELVSLSSQLGKRGKSMMTSQAGDRDLGLALFRTKDLIDDALESSLSGQTQKLFSDARGQYRNLMQLYGRGVVNEQSGDVSAKVLANNLAAKDRKGFRLGENQSDLYNAARFARAFPSIVGDSGTATRMATPLLGGAAAGGALGFASGGDPLQGAKAGLMTAAVPMALAKAYMSPTTAKYLGNEALSTGLPNEILRRLSIGTPLGILSQ